MIFNSPRLKERREGIDLLNELLKDKRKVLIVHYSCESFVTSHGRTPRVTSICVKNFHTSQTDSFSIHLQAQFDGMDFNNLSDEEYDKLELKMLNEFSNFVRSHPSYKWVHWNMRDSNFGFSAINNRVRILKGVPFDILDDFKYDLPRILSKIFTTAYEKNKPDGRLLNLAVRNNLSTINAMTGAEEAKAFDSKEYLKLHMSTLRKIDLIDSIIQRVESDDLKVNASRFSIYGTSLLGLITIVKETPWLLLIISLLGYIIGAALEPIVQNIFN